MKKPTKEEIIERWRSFEGEPQRLGLPSAPKPFLKYFEEDDRPQVKLDVDYENVAPIASYITPVPGGVGPMTIVSLLKNTVAASKRRQARK